MGRLIDLIMPERILKPVPEWRSLKRRPRVRSRPRERRCCDINMPSLANVNTFGHLIVAVRGRSTLTRGNPHVTSHSTFGRAFSALGVALPLMAGRRPRTDPSCPDPARPCDLARGRPAVDPAKVVARVNGVDITEGDLAIAADGPGPADAERARGAEARPADRLPDRPEARRQGGRGRQGRRAAPSSPASSPITGTRPCSTNISTRRPRRP